MDRWCRLVLDDQRLSGLLAGLELAEIRREQEQFVAGLLATPGGSPPRPGTHVLHRLPDDDRRRLDSYLLQAMVEEGVPPTVIMRVGEALAGAAPHDVPLTTAAAPRPRKG
jgi:hypothetical protein